MFLFTVCFCLVIHPWVCHKCVHQFMEIDASWAVYYKPGTSWILVRQFTKSSCPRSGYGLGRIGLRHGLRRLGLGPWRLGLRHGLC